MLSSRRHQYHVATEDIMAKNRLSFSHVPLYGRDDEIQRLEQSYHRVQHGQNEAVFVDAGAGTGKTALVEYVYKEWDLYASGKFSKPHEIEPDAPFAAILEALNKLCVRLAEAVPSFHLLKINLRRYLRDDAGLLLDLLPRLKDLIGSSPSDTLTQASTETSEKPPAWSFQRIKKALCTLLKAVCSWEMPVIIFIDNLQWIDPESLELLKHILLNEDIQGLLFVGAYRTAEVGYLHPLSMFFREVQLKNDRHDEEVDLIRITPIKLLDLFLPFTNALISDALRIDGAASYSLTEVIHKKTLGNPRHTSRILRLMQAEGMIFKNEERTKWTYDLERINLEVVNSVVDLLGENMESVLGDNVVTVKTAACLGACVKVEVLKEILDDQDNETIHEGLKDVAAQGIIEFFEDEKYFSFTDERLRNAAFALCDDREAFQLDLGMTLLERYKKDKETEEWSLLRATALLDGVYQRMDAKAKSELAELNLEAGGRMYRQTTFPKALTFAKAGLSIVDESLGWTSHYQTTLRLHTLVANTRVRLGEKGVSDWLTNEIIPHAKELDDKLPLYIAQLGAMSNDGKESSSIPFAIRCLRELGVRFPKNPTKAMVTMEILKTRVLTRKDTEERVRSLESVDSAKVSAAVTFLHSIVQVGYFVGRELQCMIAGLRMLRLCLRHGKTEGLSIGLAMYGIALSLSGNFKEASRFGHLALEVTDRNPQFAAAKPMAHTFVQYFLAHLFEQLHEGVDSVLYGYNTAMQIGDHAGATACASLYGGLCFLTGRPLMRSTIDLESLTSQLSPLTQTDGLWMLRLYWQTALNLSGTSPNPVVLTGKAMDVTDAEALDSPKVHWAMWQLKLVIAVVFQDRALTKTALDYLHDHRSDFRTPLCGPTRMALECMAARDLIEQDPANKGNTKRRTAIIKAYLKESEKFPRETTRHAMFFISAEKAILEKKNSHIIQDWFNKAIYTSSVAGNKLMAALGNERAGLYFLGEDVADSSQATVGNNYLQKALDAYRTWGAVGKVAALVRQHDFLAATMDEQTTQSSLDVLTGRGYHGSVCSSQSQ